MAMQGVLQRRRRRRQQYHASIAFRALDLLSWVLAYWITCASSALMPCGPSSDVRLEQSLPSSLCNESGNLLLLLLLLSRHGLEIARQCCGTFESPQPSLTHQMPTRPWAFRSANMGRMPHHVRYEPGLKVLRFGVSPARERVWWASQAKPHNSKLRCKHSTTPSASTIRNRYSYTRIDLDSAVVRDERISRRRRIAHAENSFCRACGGGGGGGGGGNGLRRRSLACPSTNSTTVGREATAAILCLMRDLEYGRRQDGTRL